MRANLWQNYGGKMAASDECFSASGVVRPHWKSLMDNFSAATAEQLELMSARVWRELRENGVSYNIEDETDPEYRLWPLDPIPLVYEKDEWAGIEKGLLQRAQLMELLLQDIYGPQHMIKSGVIPQELVYRHVKFLRAAHGSLPLEGQALSAYSANMARDEAGAMWVVNDYAERPDGWGYALENRTIVVGALPQSFSATNVHRLAPFFREFKNSLFAKAPHVEDPRVVLLTTGPDSEKYFEHAYLASYLGITLVQPGDLTVRSDKVWLKSLGGLESVDVVLRFCEGRGIDPLAAQSRVPVGVPGIMNAARVGNVAIVNPVGSGILENPGLFAFLPRVAKELLGEDLILPHAATWWCGEVKECSHVLNNLDTLVVKCLAGSHIMDTTFCSTLTKPELAILREKIITEPALYVAQQQVHYSSAPSIEHGKIEPRRALIRGFVSAKVGGGHIVMPGGLVKTAGDLDTQTVSSRVGAESKDAWVTGGNDVDYVSLWSHRGSDEIQRFVGRHLPSRAGENLFWTGRYLSRVEGLARMLRYVLKSLFFDSIPGDSIRDQHVTFVMQLIRQVEEMPEVFVNVEEELASLMTDYTRIGSMSNILGALKNSLFSVRDLWSEDSRHIINDLIDYNYSSQCMTDAFYQEGEDKMSHLIQQINSFVGISLESMTRDGGWRLLDSGRRIEQGQLVLSVLRHSLSSKQTSENESLVYQAVMVALDSLVTYRRTFHTHLREDLLLELMLVDNNNPRSLAYQVMELDKHMAFLPYTIDVGDGAGHPIRLIMDELKEKVDACVPQTLVGKGGERLLGLRLEEVSEILSKLAVALDQLYFRHADVFTPVD